MVSLCSRLAVGQTEIYRNGLERWRWTGCEKEADRETDRRQTERVKGYLDIRFMPSTQDHRRLCRNAQRLFTTTLIYSFHISLLYCAWVNMWIFDSTHVWFRCSFQGSSRWFPTSVLIFFHRSFCTSSSPHNQFHLVCIGCKRMISILFVIWQVQSFSFV